MTDKTPIDPADIRRGDLIRAEFGDREAREYVAGSDRHKLVSVSTYYLLDRPEPQVDLPSTTTLGTLTWRDVGAICDRHETALWGPSSDGKRVVSESSSVPVRLVTGFAPILTHADDETPVPAAALLALRKAWPWNAPTPVATFLAAVDADGSQP
jgi:hypothetical protein